jgi:hypothetical protein
MVLMKYTRMVKIVWLPTVLAVLLVAETLLFNWWLDIAWNSFMWRCIAASVSLSVILFFPAVFFAKRYLRYVYLAVVSLLVGLVFVSQFLYYRYSGGFLQASSLVYSGQSVDVLGTIKTLLTYKLLVFILPLLIVAIGYFAVHTAIENKRLSIKEKIIAFLLMVFVVVGGYIWKYQRFI